MAERDTRVTEAAKAKPSVIAGRIIWPRFCSGPCQNGVKAPIVGSTPKPADRM